MFHYRDKLGLEVDAIVQLFDGRWAAIEIKLGGDENIAAAACNLKALENAIDTNRTRAPEFKAIVTGGKYAYTLEDGIHVVPLGCLGP